jgi:release factor glutamine methyltransferase
MVTKYVLIPRPSTEALIDATIRYIDTSIKSGGTVDTIADIGTGSGCIAITLALEIPSLKKIYATDVSNKALNIALRNARLHQVEKKIEFIHGNLLDPIKDKQIDLVVSNPPYVPTKEIEMAGRSLKTAGLKHEPRLALDGGPDGLKFIHQLSTLAIPHIFETVGGHITQ